MIIARERTSSAVRVGRLERDRVLTSLSVALPLVVSAILNMWNLSQNGYSNTYYSVAVQSMLQSWKNFFFASYDAGGFITVDKPPVALWIQAISAKIFGFNSLSLLLPEALAGVACVALVYYLVNRIFGRLAGFVAALALALTPIAVAVERGNNTDTWLMFFLLLAATALTKATEKGRLVMLILSMALVGVAFNVKMLEAFIVLPAFYLLYLVAAPIRWYKRLIHLALASVVLFSVAFSWATVVQLTPADQRPWIGGSQTNSVFDLAFNYNGLGRVTGNEGAGSPGGNNGAQRSSTTTANSTGSANSTTQSNSQTSGAAQSSTGTQPSGMPQPPQGGFSGQPGSFGGGPAGGGGNTGNTGSSGMFGAGVAGPTRLFGSELASQWSWLLPLAGFGLAAAVLGLRRRKLLGPKTQALILWTGWAATYGVVFSMAQGIFHTYYLIMLAPAIAALVGIGVASLWRAYRNGGWQAWLLPISLVATAAWETKVLNDYNYAQWSMWLMPVAFAGSLLAALPMPATRLFTKRVWRRVAPGLVGVGLVALLITPLAWSITTATAAGNGTMPTAGPSSQNMDNGGRPGQVLQRTQDRQSSAATGITGTVGITATTSISGTVGSVGDTSGGQNGQNQQGDQPGGMGNSISSSLLSYLEANRDGYFYLVALSSANEASSVALSTGLPVLATGGFTGSDPALTAEKLAQMVASKQVRFVMGLDNSRDGSSSSSTSSVSSWIQQNCSAVATSAYSSTSTSTTASNFGGNSQLYDCAAK